MDPDVTFQLLLDAIAADQHEDIAEHAENLQTWMERGGFAPTFGLGHKRARFMDWLVLMHNKAAQSS